MGIKIGLNNAHLAEPDPIIKLTLAVKSIIPIILTWAGILSAAKALDPLRAIIIPTLDCVKAEMN